MNYLLSSSRMRVTTTAKEDIVNQVRPGTHSHGKFYARRVY